MWAEMRGAAVALVDNKWQALQGERQRRPWGCGADRRLGPDKVTFLWDTPPPGTMTKVLLPPLQPL